MRIRKLTINEIKYEKKIYSETLYNSVIKIGFSFPIHVKYINNEYICIDGHKRLSILEDILNKDPLYKRGNTVNVIVLNNGDIRSNDCSRGRNTH